MASLAPNCDCADLSLAVDRRAYCFFAEPMWSCWAAKCLHWWRGIARGAYCVERYTWSRNRPSPPSFINTTTTIPMMMSRKRNRRWPYPPQTIRRRKLSFLRPSIGKRCRIRIGRRFTTPGRQRRLDDVPSLSLPLLRSRKPLQHAANRQADDALVQAIISLDSSSKLRRHWRSRRALIAGSVRLRTCHRRRLAGCWHSQHSVSPRHRQERRRQHAETTPQCRATWTSTLTFDRQSESAIPTTMTTTNRTRTFCYKNSHRFL